MKIPPFDSKKQFLSMVLVKYQHYSDLRSLEVKRYHISHNFPEQCKQCITKANLSLYIVCEPRHHFPRSFFARKVTSTNPSGNSIREPISIWLLKTENQLAGLARFTRVICGIFTRKKNAYDNNNSRNIYL
jgi:hypothetical protein